jgi:hypothetical protein
LDKGTPHLDREDSVGRCIPDITCRDEINTETDDVAMYSSDNRKWSTLWSSYGMLEGKYLFPHL